jgi:1-acyl-sn-glycerol-3-phosphate acyltransferase
VIGLHPEGTISPSFVPRGRTGAVRLARATRAPIVPVAVWGSHRLLTKWRPAKLTRHVAVSVRYGEPFHPSAGSPEEATAELMRRIAGLLAESQADLPPAARPAAGGGLVDPRPPRRLGPDPRRGRSQDRRADGRAAGTTGT